jgi:hypothetical protein
VEIPLQESSFIHENMLHCLSMRSIDFDGKQSAGNTSTQYYHPGVASDPTNSHEILCNHFYPMPEISDFHSTNSELAKSEQKYPVKFTLEYAH